MASSAANAQVQDVKAWEKLHGKRWYELSAAERCEANEQISAMKG